MTAYNSPYQVPLIHSALEKLDRIDIRFILRYTQTSILKAEVQFPDPISSRSVFIRKGRMVQSEMFLHGGCQFQR